VSYIIEMVPPSGDSFEFEWSGDDDGLPAFLAWLTTYGVRGYQVISLNKTRVCILPDTGPAN